MATRAAKPNADWRAAFRRSLARSAQLTGAGLLFAFAFFMALALVSHSQTDPSLSTAAGDVVDNWMGRPGAFVADLAFTGFGFVAILLLPLSYVFARKLWRDADEEEHWDGAWWRTVGVLLIAMTLIATVFALVTDPREWSLPAGTGGLAGLLGAQGITALAGLLPETGRFWAILAGGLTCLGAGALLAGRVFAVDWARLLTIPDWFGNLPRLSAPANPFKPDEPKRRTKRQGKGKTADGEESTVPNPFADRKPPEIVDPAAPAARARPAAKKQQKDLFADYELPAIDLLEEGDSDQVPVLDKLALERNARLLETVLDDFNVKGEITAVKTGPVVTMYELEPAPGIKASRVIGLAEDIARNMSAISARVSPIPGKTVMGIELPNADRQTVNFREMVESEAFVSHKGSLPIILGKGISGDPIVEDLAAMPHLLVAGTTGSGKSVGLNTVLLSLLYRFTPAECRLILIDPKVLELKSYDDIPHLLAPVVTEPHKSVRSLKWAVEEMEKRYRMMSEIGARNLAGFNERVAAAAAKGKPLKRTVQTGYDPETGEAIVEEAELDYEVLPKIVLIVDELADLMVVVGKEIEVLIQRLSQKSRAAGIHLIMATQRPSVDVITGVIKANLPTRISFNVTSRIDSRTILGEQGAEQLLGKGDMLYKPNTGAIKRVHGPFVSDEEVEKVATHWRGQGEPAYVDSVTEEPEDGGGFGFDDELTASDNPEERKYRQAIQIVCENQKASGSWLQRQLGVGYNTAAKLIERMEEEGIVGPANHVGRREIFRDRDGNPL
ncbi:FtsK/SpoIIIE family DNA translocase [Aurantiacibacter gangjinensis]|uniref:DNA translocase FtsK n=1 Tax=Aurantiacibacter gangjinensis TaxID=502682 RepID=A0A0G9MPZ9_9SPHN|nr:DNA translocase FtsK 4TM domain-containing protein [Aurantiacibacter gangjinensis]APE27267.1 Cell division protein FtsK [Aurantiacibacter gangjinensis]KLE31383.1 cell division protein FtsK [Aurantiacibacter gangjinensis]